MSAGPDPAIAALITPGDRAQMNALRARVAMPPTGPKPESIYLPPDGSPGGNVLTPLDLEEAAKATPPRREFALHDWLPMGESALLAGIGGGGKSLAIQQVASAMVLGEHAFGIATMQGPAMLVFCEEDNDELWRRQRRIADRAGRNLAEYKGLHLFGRAGHDNTLVSFVGGIPVAEALLHTIEANARALGVKLLVLDNVAHLFGGNENDRHMVTVFGSLITRLAKAVGCAVVLVGHPGKATIGATAEYSGTTAWEAIVRARLWLERPKGGDEEDPEYMVLRRQKANYAPGVAKVEIVNVGGVFELRDAGQAQRAASERVAGARSAIVAALQALDRMGVHVSHSPRAGNFVLKVARDLGHLAGHRDGELREALAGLLADGEIVANADRGKGADRHPIRGLSLVGSQQRLSDAG